METIKFLKESIDRTLFDINCSNILHSESNIDETKHNLLNGRKPLQII